MLTGAWILALLMAGAPLIAMAGGTETEGVGDDAAEDPEDDIAVERSDELAEADPPHEPEEEPDAEGEDDVPPTDYEFILGSGGDHTVEGFRPGIDTLTLTSDTWDFDLYDLGDDGTGPAVEIAMGEDRSVLKFPGLDTLPVDDVWLHVAEPGSEPQRIALRDALHPAEDDVLAPADPDAPDDLPTDASDGPALAPADPDAPDDQRDQTGSGEALAPTDPDAPEDAPRLR
jgi:hypothetical protein